MFTYNKLYSYLLLEKYTPSIETIGIEKDVYSKFFKLYQHCKTLTAPIEYGPPNDRKVFKFNMPEILKGDIQTLGQRLLALDVGDKYKNGTSGEVIPHEYFKIMNAIENFYSLFYILTKEYDKHTRLKQNKLNQDKQHKSLHFNVNNCEIYIPVSVDDSMNYLKHVNAAQSRNSKAVPWCTGYQNKNNMTEYYLSKGIKLIYIKYDNRIEDILCVGLDNNNNITFNTQSTVDFYNRPIKNLNYILNITSLTESDIHDIINSTNKINYFNDSKIDINDTNDFNICEFVLDYKNYISGYTYIKIKYIYNYSDGINDIQSSIDELPILKTAYSSYTSSKVSQLIYMLNCGLYVDMTLDDDSLADRLNKENLKPLLLCAILYSIVYKRNIFTSERANLIKMILNHNSMTKDELLSNFILNDAILSTNNELINAINAIH